MASSEILTVRHPRYWSASGCMANETVTPLGALAAVAAHDPSPRLVDRVVVRAPVEG